MKKEKLTAASVKSDLMQILNAMDYNISDARMAFIVPFSIFAVVLGVVLQNVFVGLVIGIFPAYHIFRYIMELRAIKATKRALTDGIERGEISVSVEKLSHIAEETIYEPHSNRRYGGGTKEILTFYFYSGDSWRLRPIMYYSWSKEMYMSPMGVYNTSVGEDEFYVVRLQKQYEVACVYNTKLFEWEE